MFEQFVKVYVVYEQFIISLPNDSFCVDLSGEVQKQMLTTLEVGE